MQSGSSSLNMNCAICQKSTNAEQECILWRGQVFHHECRQKMQRCPECKEEAAFFTLKHKTDKDSSDLNNPQGLYCLLCEIETHVRHCRACLTLGIEKDMRHVKGSLFECQRCDKVDQEKDDRHPIRERIVGIDNLSRVSSHPRCKKCGLREQEYYNRCGDKHFYRCKRCEEKCMIS
jgi:hypothetical protein